MKKQIEQFMIEGGQLPVYDERRQVMLYTGLQAEEFSEKLEALGLIGPAEMLKSLSSLLKKGTYDSMYKPDYVACLDADVDLIWVTIESSLCQGNDIEGGFDEVATSNYPGKLWPDGKMHRDENGKILKPANWQEPDLRKYVQDRLSAQQSEGKADSSS